jgi:hypothetical protein
MAKTARISITDLGDGHDLRYEWSVSTVEGEFTGAATDRQEAIGQARTVALAYGHDESDVELSGGA